MIKQLKISVPEESLPAVKIHKSSSPRESVPDLPRKPKRPLAVWTSLISAKALTAYYETHHTAASQSDLEIISFEDLAFLEERSIGDYELLYMGIYEGDSFSECAMRIFDRLSLQKKNQSQSPVTICHCGRAESLSGQRWRRAIGKLSDCCNIQIHYFHNEIYRGEFSM